MPENDANNSANATQAIANGSPADQTGTIGSSSSLQQQTVQANGVSTPPFDNVTTTALKYLIGQELTTVLQQFFPQANGHKAAYPQPPTANAAQTASASNGQPVTGPEVHARSQGHGSSWQNPPSTSNTPDPIQTGGTTAAPESAPPADPAANPALQDTETGGQDYYNEQEDEADFFEDAEATYNPQGNYGSAAPNSTPFSESWYESLRGHHITPRFILPPRYDIDFPVCFPPESVKHFRLFTQTSTSQGRAEEAAHIYASATYETQNSNDLCTAVNQLLHLRPEIPSPHARVIDEIILILTRAQVRTRGVYELQATRYELLAGRQGASGVADPEVLSALSNAPAAYSTAGSHAYQTQQSHAVRYAALRAGRREQRSPYQPSRHRAPGRPFPSQLAHAPSASHHAPASTTPTPTTNPSAGNTAASGTNPARGRGGRGRSRGRGRQR